MSTALPEDPPPIHLTRALEDYLETVYLLVRDGGYARVRDIAKARSVRSASVSPALRRLADLGLLDYERREYVGLTPAGEAQARRVFARHRLLTRLFHKVLQLPEEAAESEACAMEHSLSDEGMDRLTRLFEFMEVCPDRSGPFLDTFHRCPLVNPDAPPCEHDCEPQDRVHRQTTRTVFDLKPGQRGRVTQVRASGAIRQRLLDMGILPRAELEVERTAPGGEPVWIRLLGFQLALRRTEAEAVIIDPESIEP